MKKLTLKMDSVGLSHTTPYGRGKWGHSPVRFTVRLLLWKIVITAIPSCDGWTVDVEVPFASSWSPPRGCR